MLALWAYFVCHPTTRRVYNGEENRRRVKRGQTAVFYLIDGYNLLHAMGALHPQVAPGELERARKRLISLLKGSFGDDAVNVTVVFDAHRRAGGLPEQSMDHGIQVLFAVGRPEADDLIEEIIRSTSVPRQLTVVSNDHRIQTAAQRRRCPVLDCEQFLRILENRRPQPPPTASIDTKPAAPSEGETHYWVREFANLADDPAFEELFDPFDFLKSARDEPQSPESSPSSSN